MPRRAFALVLLAVAVAPVAADDAHRAEAAAAAFNQGSPAADRASLRAFAECGTAAVPVLRGLLLDDGLLNRHEELLDALVQSGGPASAPVLAELLRAEAAYWHNLGLNIDSPKAISAVRHQRLQHILAHLHKLGGRKERELVGQIRELFATHPVYTAFDTERRVVTAADAILR